MMNEEEPGVAEGLDRRWLRLVAVFLLLVLLTGVLAAPFSLFYRWYERNERGEIDETTAGDSESRIAFITLDGQLATMNATGGDLRQLTDQSRRHMFPTWSPDDSLLAVIGGDSILVLQDRPNGSVQEIYKNITEPPFYLFWSPDSKRLSYLTAHPDGIALNVTEREEGFGEKQLITVGQPLYWDWLPLGDQLLVHTGLPGRESQLVLMNADSSVRLNRIAVPGYFQAPVVSTDGRFWAYAEISGSGASQLVIETLESRDRVVHPLRGEVALGWRPGADQLAFISPAEDRTDSQGRLQLMDANTGDVRTLSEEKVVAFFWAPDGRHIAFLTILDTRGRGIQLAIDRADRALSSGAALQDDRFLLDLWLVEVQSGESSHLLTFEPSPVFRTQFLPFFDQYALSHRIWDPSSKSLLVPMLQGGVPHVTLVAIADAPALPLTVGQIGFWSHN